MGLHFKIDRERIGGFCRSRGIRGLALYGSALRGELRPDSDVDVLVEFEKDRVPGLIRLGEMAEELGAILGAGPVDLRTPEDLSELFRDDVVTHALSLYERT